MLHLTTNYFNCYREPTPHTNLFYLLPTAPTTSTSTSTTDCHDHADLNRHNDDDDNGDDGDDNDDHGDDGGADMHDHHAVFMMMMICDGELMLLTYGIDAIGDADDNDIDDVHGPGFCGCAIHLLPEHCSATMLFDSATMRYAAAMFTLCAVMP